MTQHETYFTPYGGVTENELAQERAGQGPHTSAMLIIGGKAIGFANAASAFQGFAATTPKAPVIPLRQQELPATFPDISEAV
jgi:hypothetical protein